MSINPFPTHATRQVAHRAAAEVATLVRVGAVLACSMLAMVGPSRLIATQAQAAARFKVTPKTIRNWISKGLITGFRTPTGRGIRVDLSEIERVMSRIPTTVARPGTNLYGPRARIVDLASTPVVVTRDDSGNVVEQG